jgi:hypothetical protein
MVNRGFEPGDFCPESPNLLVATLDRYSRSLIMVFDFPLPVMENLASRTLAGVVAKFFVAL